MIDELLERIFQGVCFSSCLSADLCCGDQNATTLTSSLPYNFIDGLGTCPFHPRQVEENDYRQQQRRVGEIFMLAELYNCAIVRSQCVFEVLEVLLKYGHEIPKDRMNPRYRKAGVGMHHPLVLSYVDRPDDPFRVKLVYVSLSLDIVHRLCMCLGK